MRRAAALIALVAGLAAASSATAGPTGTEPLSAEIGWLTGGASGAAAPVGLVDDLSSVALIGPTGAVATRVPPRDPEVAAAQEPSRLAVGPAPSGFALAWRTLAPDLRVRGALLDSRGTANLRRAGRLEENAADEIATARSAAGQAVAWTDRGITRAAFARPGAAFGPAFPVPSGDRLRVMPAGRGFWIVGRAGVARLTARGLTTPARSLGGTVLDAVPDARGGLFALVRSGRRVSAARVSATGPVFSRRLARRARGVAIVQRPFAARAILRARRRTFARDISLGGTVGAVRDLPSRGTPVAATGLPGGGLAIAIEDARGLALVKVSRFLSYARTYRLDRGLVSEVQVAADRFGHAYVAFIAGDRSCGRDASSGYVRVVDGRRVRPRRTVAECKPG